MAVHECEQMVGAIAGSDCVPRRIIRQIVERIDGVPLFVEEFTRAIVDSGAVPLAAASPVPSGKLPDLVPASIQDSLMERLDRLGPAKRVAQIASVFGRRFNYEGIFSVLPGKGQTVKDSLRALERAGIVYRSEETQGTDFTFKHAMIQEVAYSSLLKEEMRDLHARVASWLLQEAPIGERTHPPDFSYLYPRA